MNSLFTWLNKPKETPRFSEKDAESLLFRAGYQIIGKQQKGNIIASVNGRDHFSSLQADYIVRRDKKDYVVTVKSAEEVADPNEPAYRRKLLEFDRVFSPDGILILDSDQGEIHEVQFQFPRERRFSTLVLFMIAVFIIIAIIAIIGLFASIRLL